MWFLFGKTMSLPMFLSAADTQFKMGLCCYEKLFSPLRRRQVSKSGGLVGKWIPCEGLFPSFPVERSRISGLHMHLRNIWWLWRIRLVQSLMQRWITLNSGRTSPNQIQLKPGKSLPSLVNSKEHTCSMFKLNEARVYWDPHTSLIWTTMPWWTSGEEHKYRRWSNLENSPQNHIFSGQRRFLLVLSQTKLTTPRIGMIN